MLDLKTFHKNLDKCNKYQKEAILHTKGNCAVIAAAGSGKSFILVNRICNLILNGVSPDNILAVSFSRDAANVIKERIVKLMPEIKDSISINTFHSIGWKMLKTHVTRFQESEIARDWWKKKTIIDIVKNNMKLVNKDSDVDVNNILRFMEYQQNNMRDINDKMLPMQDQPYTISVMQEIYEKFENIKKKERMICFGDMLMGMYQLLKKNTKIRHEYQSQFLHIMADETQELNPIQYELIKLLGIKCESLMILGDFRQNIYEFNCSNSKYLLDFYKEWTDCKVINSKINYRCQKNIIDMSNLLIKDSIESKHPLYEEAIAFKAAGKDVNYNVYFDAMDEAEHVAIKIKELITSGIYKYQDIYVLIRLNSQSRVFEEVFMREEIPYFIESGMSFYERSEIQDMLAYITLAYNTNSNASWSRIINKPNRFLGSIFKDEVEAYATAKNISLYESMQSFPRHKEWRYQKNIEAFVNIIYKIQKKLGKSNIGNIIAMIRKELDYDNYITKESDSSADDIKSDNLDSFQEQASQYVDVEKFLESINKLIHSKEDKVNKKTYGEAKAVVISSIHKAKGNEKEVVFSVGFSQSILPHSKGNESEELRLAYVSVTRAISELYISSILHYNDKDVEVSDFIYNFLDRKDVDIKVDRCMDRQSKNKIKLK